MRYLAWTLALVLTASIATAQDDELPPIDAIVAMEADEDGAYWNVTADELAAHPAVARAVAAPGFITTLEEDELASTHAFFDEVIERDVLGIRLDGKTYSVGITLAHALPPPSPQSDEGEESPGPAALAVLAAVAGSGFVLRRRR